MPQKLVLEIDHPEDSLREISQAIRVLQQPNVTIAEIRRCSRVFREAHASVCVLRAYNRYRKLQIKILEERIRNIERKRRP
jgi:hypothetical protein